MAIETGWNEQWRQMLRVKKEKGFLENLPGWFSIGLGLAALAVLGITALDLYRSRRMRSNQAGA